MNFTILQYSNTPTLAVFPLGPKQKSYFLTNPATQSLFQLEPNPQEPVPGKPGEGGRRADPLMIEFKIRFELSDLESLAKLALEDRLNTHRVARFNKDCDGLNRQQISHPGNFLCQADLVVGGNFDKVAQQFLLLAVNHFLQSFFAQVNFLSGIVIVSGDHEVGFVL